IPAQALISTLGGEPTSDNGTLSSIAPWWCVRRERPRRGVVISRDFREPPPPGPVREEAAPGQATERPPSKAGPPSSRGRRGAGRRGAGADFRGRRCRAAHFSSRRRNVGNSWGGQGAPGSLVRMVPPGYGPWRALRTSPRTPAGAGARPISGSLVSISRASSAETPAGQITGRPPGRTPPPPGSALS